MATNCHTRPSATWVGEGWNSFLRFAFQQHIRHRIELLCIVGTCIRITCIAYAFRQVQHGVGGNAYDLWTSGGYNDEDLTHHSIFQTGDHFVSNKISSMWDDAGTYLNAVHIGAFNGNRRVNHFSFAASGTDTLSWHSKDNLVDSSYNDVLTSTQNYFGIAADTTNERNWCAIHFRRSLQAELPFCDVTFYTLHRILGWSAGATEGAMLITVGWFSMATAPIRVIGSQGKW